MKAYGFVIYGTPEVIALKCALELALEHDSAGAAVYGRMLKRVTEGLHPQDEPGIGWLKTESSISENLEETGKAILRGHPCHQCPECTAVKQVGRPCGACGFCEV